MSLIIEYTFIIYKQKNKIYEFIISLFNFFSNKIFSLVSQLTFNYKSKIYNIRNNKYEQQKTNHLCRHGWCPS